MGIIATKDIAKLKNSILAFSLDPQRVNDWCRRKWNITSVETLNQDQYATLSCKLPEFSRQTKKEQK